MGGELLMQDFQGRIPVIQVNQTASRLHGTTQKWVKYRDKRDFDNVLSMPMIS